MKKKTKKAVKTAKRTTKVVSKKASTKAPKAKAKPVSNPRLSDVVDEGVAFTKALAPELQGHWRRLMNAAELLGNAINEFQNYATAFAKQPVVFAKPVAAAKHVMGNQRYTLKAGTKNPLARVERDGKAYIEGAVLKLTKEAIFDSHERAKSLTDSDSVYWLDSQEKVVGGQFRPLERLGFVNGDLVARMEFQREHRGYLVFVGDKRLGVFSPRSRAEEVAAAEIALPEAAIGQFIEAAVNSDEPVEITGSEPLKVPMRVLLKPTA